MLQLCSNSEVSAHTSFDCPFWLSFMQTILMVADGGARSTSERRYALSETPISNLKSMIR